MAKISMQVSNMTISQFIQDVETGKYHLPSFQREYVWDLDDIKNLIDSVINNYPIGTIILWKPSKREVDMFSRPLVDTTNKSIETLYVIDGQQRLTSLLLLLRDWKIQRNNETVGFNTAISYSSTTNKFFKSSNRGIDVARIIKAFCQFDIEELNSIIKGKDPSLKKQLQEKFGGLLNYRVPIYLMETYNEDETTFKEMAEAFTRVNKYGVTMGNLELMLSFLAGSISGSLKNKVHSLYHEMDEKFKIDLQLIIRFTFYQFSLKQSQISRVERFTKNLEKIQALGEENLDIIFNDCKIALELTVEFIKKELKLSSAKFLPSQIPLIVIATFFYKTKIDSLEELDSFNSKSIINWFILTSFYRHYSSNTDNKLDEDLSLISNTIIFPTELTKKVGNNKSNRGKITESDIINGRKINILRGDGKGYLLILYLILAKNNAEDWNSSLIGNAELKDISKHHIFPKDYLEENLSTEDLEEKDTLLNNLGNITFINRNINSSIGDDPPEEYMKEYIEVIGKHLIPKEENLWSIDQYTTFLDYRVKQIFKEGERLFPEIFVSS